VLNPFRTTDKSIFEDTDLAGPLVFCLAFGGFLLLVSLSIRMKLFERLLSPRASLICGLPMINVELLVPSSNIHEKLAGERKLPTRNPHFEMQVHLRLLLTPTFPSSLARFSRAK
jgi:hypothetical protein